MMILATRSAGKLRELRPLFVARGIPVIDLSAAGIVESPSEDALEVFESFEKNALAKARYFHGLSGQPTVADDSGLVVRVLGGMPGVRSKRWSARPDLTGQALDDENNRLLLERLASVTAFQERDARYVCAAAFVDGVRELVCSGGTSGRILEVPRGTNGFGYDPYFDSDELGMTFAEAGPALKATVSHRGRAFTALIGAMGDATAVRTV